MYDVPLELLDLKAVLALDLLLSHLYKLLKISLDHLNVLLLLVDDSLKSLITRIDSQLKVLDLLEARVSLKLYLLYLLNKLLVY